MSEIIIANNMKQYLKVNNYPACDRIPEITTQRLRNTNVYQVANMKRGDMGNFSHQTFLASQSCQFPPLSSFIDGSSRSAHRNSTENMS